MFSFMLKLQSFQDQEKGTSFFSIIFDCGCGGFSFRIRSRARNSTNCSSAFSLQFLFVLSLFIKCTSAGSYFFCSASENTSLIVWIQVVISPNWNSLLVYSASFTDASALFLLSLLSSSFTLASLRPPLQSSTIAFRSFATVCKFRHPSFAW